MEQEGFDRACRCLNLAQISELVEHVVSGEKTVILLIRYLGSHLFDSVIN